MPDSANIARHLPLMAARQPDRPALKIPRGRTADGRIDYLALTFRELDAEVDAWCARLTAAGLKRGDRTLVMVKQGLPLIAAVFALFKVGAVPVVIDPGMGLKSFLRCVSRSQPRALLGIPIAQVISRLFFRTFASVRIRVTASPSLTARQSNPIGDFVTPRISKEENQSNLLGYCPAAEVAPDELAAILFTSGSTGAPKGVCYEHGMFEAQVRLIRAHYAIEPGEVDLPMLPIFALFNPALGMTTIVPEIDPRRPAQVDPAKIVQAIQQEGVTNSFGSPTLWLKIQRHCLAQNVTLPTMKRVLCAGAPVPAALWGKPQRWLTNGQLHSPYGATESLPVSSVSADEIDPKTVRGACVGRSLPEITARVIAITDEPIAALSEAHELPVGEIGEIIVRGPVVTRTYDALPEATAAAKIKDGGDSWHRMGDCGYFDAAGRLWFCGRKVERVQTAAGVLFTEPCEQVFRSYPLVVRCALIGLGEPGAQTPALVVQPIADKTLDQRALAHELRRLAVAHDHTRGIERFYFHNNFPVDVRHNAKIHRLQLARWARTAQVFKVTA
ncbi:MAG: AMP-binding protein [Opitutaceae bacterium]|nr:AMP-binding protein [Cephaloticoccus sp.]MCP5529088.1 AMP-binding protein [Opitutaceae bacterium]